MKLKTIAFFVLMLLTGLLLITYSISAEAVESYSVYPPSDTISEAQIQVYDTKVIITIPGAQWASYTSTKSMEPVLNENAHGIEIVPKSIEEIHIGDIVAYKTKYSRIPVVHRVVGIKKDELGIYFVLKGDNNMKRDPENVRFEQIRYKLVAVIY